MSFINERRVDEPCERCGSQWWTEQNEFFPLCKYLPKSQSIFIIISVFCRIENDERDRMWKKPDRQRSTHKITAFKMKQYCESAHLGLFVAQPNRRVQHLTRIFYEKSQSRQFENRIPFSFHVESFSSHIFEIEFKMTWNRAYSRSITSYECSSIFLNARGTRNQL